MFCVFLHRILLPEMEILLFLFSLPVSLSNLWSECESVDISSNKNVSFASAYFAPTCEIMHTFDVVIKIVLILKKAKKKRLKKGLKHKIDWYL